MVNNNRNITTSGVGNNKLGINKNKKYNYKNVSKKNNNITKERTTKKEKRKDEKRTDEKRKDVKRKDEKRKEKKTKKRKIQGGGYNKEKTVCAPYMVQKRLIGKGLNKNQALDSNGKMIIAEKGKKVEVIPTVHPDSCMGKMELRKILKAWNTSYPDETIMVQKDNGLVKSDDKLWEELRNKIDKHISKLTDEGEHEWWEQDFVKNTLGLGNLQAIQDSIYAPEAPESWKEEPNTWLNTLDIEDVLNQYEKMYPEFKSFGASPIDFDLVGSDGSCQVNPLCKISINKLMKGEGCGGKEKKYIGVVFNLDKHYESGSHWIALFVNIPKGEINFWDSYGYNPPEEVNKLMEKIEKQLASSELFKGLSHGTNNKKVKIQINNKRHQYKNSECGVYSLHFIIKQLEGDSYQKVCENKISDDEMNNYRQMFFTNAK